MKDFNSKLFDLMILLNNNEIKKINHINQLGYNVLKSNNYVYIENYLLNVDWKRIDKNLLIKLISKVIQHNDRKVIEKIIKKLYMLEKYDIIEKAYSINNNETTNEVIVNRARNFITSNYHSEDVYDEFLDAKVFLGLLCDLEADEDNINRSFELVKHIKPKKNIK